MKITTRILVALGSLAGAVPGWTSPAQTAESPKHEELTVWVTSQLGSHIGSGYTSTYLTNIRARTIGKEDARLKKAINSLDGLGMMPVTGFGLVPAAVAWQTDTRMRNLIQEQADTGLSYGELLMAHAIILYRTGDPTANTTRRPARSPAVAGNLRACGALTSAPRSPHIFS